MAKKAATVKSVTGLLPKLKTQMAKQHEVKAKAVAEAMGDEAKTLLELTINDPASSGTMAFAGAQVIVKIITRTGPKGASAKVRIFMADRAGKPHEIWGYLNFGTPDRVQTRTSPPIPERVAPFNNARTIPNSFFTGGFRGYTGDTYVISAGTPVRGIAPRNWYILTEQKLKELSSKQFRGWKIKAAKINPHR